MRKLLQRLKHAIRGTPRALARAFLFCVSACWHVFYDTARAARRNWKPLTAMAFSALLLGIGFVRLANYSVPMLSGDFAAAGKGLTEYTFEEEGKQPPEPEIFGKDTLFDKVVVGGLRQSWKGIDFVVGDRVEAKFDHGLSLYRENRYEEAITALNKAYVALNDNNGKVKPKYRKLASEIQLLIGNAYANTKKDGEAINAYQLSLTFDPNNLITIYNLERLLTTGGGKGGDNGDKPKPSNPSNTKV